MRIVVVGAGGVGGYFGARLAAAGQDVTFVARGRHLAAIQEHGLVVRSPLGEFASAVTAVPTIAEAPPADLVLIAVKLWDTEEVAAQLKPAVAAGQKLVFGEFDGSTSALVTDFLAACGSAGVDAEVSANIARVIWEKFVFMVGLSATTAAVRQPIGVVRANTRTRALLRDVMAEVVAVGRASGVDLTDEVDERLAFVDTLPPDMAASMYHDLLRGGRLELPWLSGGVAALGARLGVPTPRNSTVADVLAPYELGAI